ncbi:MULTISPECIES: uroporphyrinogen decarboxylase [Ehrlichia]|uniref:Uroporphyrinogen decarboxylase n=1 Tax=Ehrlichia cf. muris str. EmCRT TaxID=1359167 RepID=A0A0F3N731_9RICK|nr:MULTISPECIES: uroporphyrinogen decarboxylase [Ehrlichia]KJV63531.1 uroporphyrinogen decarboxylase [Ehrlichia cf. muris str. EmCRT]OUC04166.1 uroporphyrinogen decarboxylase [Ehrlichia sp. Wisconsin_h]
MLRTITSRSKQKKVPIWFMRQAGRYLPEYHEVTKNTGSFLELCYTPELVKEVTLQPIKRFGLDAAIIFSDILVIPDALGCRVRFTKEDGPKLQSISSYEEINIPEGAVLDHLKNVFKGIEEVKRSLQKDIPLIGFAGAPWTIASYMIGRDKNFSKIREMCYSQGRNLEKIIEKTTEVTISYLKQQIESGVDIIQIFDSNAGIVSASEFKKWIIDPTKKIVSSIRESYPEFPIIGFPKGAGIMYKQFSEETKVSVTSIDYNIPISWAKNNIPSILQGNIDPYLVAYDKDKAVSQTRDLINTMKDEPFIFNLGHGIIPSTPIANIEALIEIVRSGI